MFIKEIWYILLIFEFNFASFKLVIAGYQNAAYKAKNLSDLPLVYA